MVIYVPFILFEGIGKSIPPYNTDLFLILLYYQILR